MGLKFLCLALAAAANGLSVSAPYRPTTSHFAARATTPKLALAGVPLHRSASAEFTATRSRPPVLALRGGLAFVPSTLALPATVDGSFQLIFSVLTAACAALVYGTREKVDPSAEKEVVPTEVRSWQRRFLIVFWLFKMADWLQGPYFYEVYASKIINGVAVSSAGVARLFLTGFGSTALFGAIVGGLVDSLGRKRGSLMFALMYAVSALSTRGNTLPLLFAGRVAGGIGTSLLFSAPEAWLVSEHQKNKFDGKFLGQTFGLAYFGDAIVAIMAGQLAGFVAAGRGPTAPFELSVLFLAAGAAFVTFFWKENFGGKAQAVATSEASGAEEEEASTGGQDSGKLIGEATSAMFEDKKILLVGAVQALFEGAMYIFVLQWPPALKAALGAGVAVPFGKIFSWCAMLGSTTFRGSCGRARRREHHDGHAPRRSRVDDHSDDPGNWWVVGASDREPLRLRGVRGHVLPPYRHPALQVPPRRLPGRHHEPLRHPAQPHRCRCLPLHLEARPCRATPARLRRWPSQPSRSFCSSGLSAK